MTDAVRKSTLASMVHAHLEKSLLTPCCAPIAACYPVLRTPCACDFSLVCLAVSYKGYGVVNLLVCTATLEEILRHDATLVEPEAWSNNNACSDRLLGH